eukprot:TRINITY_DN80747_c0_g1_i1.p1 TRINITY_DN80747_c0_g1~~TRINITY_DN80747_c0_g1_i1.p1  ORF type:complete len:303 (+),score=63.65 TRINITY_DN80747_c0_g1_i1:85-993(+)
MSADDPVADDVRAASASEEKQPPHEGREEGEGEVLSTRRPSLSQWWRRKGNALDMVEGELEEAHLAARHAEAASTFSSPRSVASSQASGTSAGGPDPPVEASQEEEEASAFSLKMTPPTSPTGAAFADAVLGAASPLRNRRVTGGAVSLDDWWLGGRQPPSGRTPRTKVMRLSRGSIPQKKAKKPAPRKSIDKAKVRSSYGSSCGSGWTTTDVRRLSGAASQATQEDAGDCGRPKGAWFAGCTWGEAFGELIVAFDELFGSCTGAARKRAAEIRRRRKSKSGLSVSRASEPDCSGPGTTASD